MDKICTSPQLVKLLGEESSSYPEDTIPFHKSFPHEYIPDEIKETDRFINFEIRADLDLRNNVLKDLTVWFFVVCHQYVVPYIENGRSFLWYDCVVCELDNLFTDKNFFGIGNMSLITNAPYYPHQKFKGRQLTFKLKDFTNGLKYGK